MNDKIVFDGQYAYIEGILDSVYILPETELTMEITRLPAASSTVGGVQYGEYAGGGADGSKPDGQPTYHTFKGGAFSINITAPPITNEYTYQFKLVNLPEGALDTTEAACATSSSFGCGEFVIKVDANAPTIVANTWTARDEAGTALEKYVSTSNFRCIDISVQILEKEAMFEGDVSVAWKFYIDPLNDLTWPFYGQVHGIDPLTEPLSLTPVAGGYAATADCVDLWPSTEQELPTQEQINNIEVVFWVVGSDSAGSPVLGGGPTGEGSVAPIFSVDDRYNSLYEFIYEEADYLVQEIDLLPRSPEVGESMTLTIEVFNNGTKPGEATLRIQSVVEGGIPVTEKIVTSSLIPVGEEVDVGVTLESFANPTTGMYYLIFDNVTGDLLYDGSESKWGDTFNVKIASENDDSGMLQLIIVILIGLILVMGIAGLVVMRRGNNDMDDYLYEDEVETKAYATLPGQDSETAAPPADVSPQMAEAMQKFPQWSQAEIQGYFDQGWDIASLQDWLDNQ